MKKHVGVWVDHEKAFVASIIKDDEMTKETIHCIKSNVEGHFRLSGGARSRTPYGPQDVASEKKIDERRKQFMPFVVSPFIFPSSVGVSNRFHAFLNP